MVDGDTAVIVTNKAHDVSIRTVNESVAKLLTPEWLYYFKPCSEEEFNASYSDALAIVTMKKIP